MMIRSLMLVPLFLLMPASFGVAQASKPLRVYILAGQSNMVGTGGISTLDYIGDDPKTEMLLEQMQGRGEQPKVCDRVWISSLNGKGAQYGGEGVGKLTAGYGFRRDDPTQHGDCIGPEFMFGIAMEQVYDGPILLIKTAWGGRSLSVDFRPPGAGPYQFNDAQIAKHTSKGDLEKVAAQKKEATGKNYHYMIEHVQKVLGDLKRVCPEYDAEAGYELSGFVWFQGWNDYVDAGTYNASEGSHQFDPYSELLEQLIRDVRKDLHSPKLPFVIGVMGMHGNFTPGTFNPRGNAEEKMIRFRKAMAAPASLPEFKGNVIAVQTAPFNEAELGRINMKLDKVKQFGRRLKKENESKTSASGSLSPSEIKERIAEYRAELVSPEEEATWQRGAGTGGFVHYFGAAKFHAQAGQAFAKALQSLDAK
ncbi:protein of unknown function [Neorhodopirellula lusitana]|uniref:Sialate O-acetylesterase domain-containing protein n=1 Tax=Neorhodopirellula lusitana TaxID=445327 RepID=A0ABY1QM95_9BACT|nr:sialate O-acetylesterase [Neorhodopirellula lusitana]SMP75412.1 protein of unknown function [Neorhodopirellula lusitana]